MHWPCSAVGGQTQTELFFHLDDGKEQYADGYDQYSVEQGNRLGAKNLLRDRQVGNERLRWNHDGHANPHRPCPTRSSPSQRGAKNVANEEQMKNLQYDQHVHCHGLRRNPFWGEVTHVRNMLAVEERRR